MVIVQNRSKRKSSGGRYKTGQAKKLHQRGRKATMTAVGIKTLRSVRTKGGSRKLKLLREEVANVYDSKTKKYTKAKIKTILETPANQNYARRNIITKGTLIDTEAGKAKVTGRPGQDGIVNAVLV